MGQEKHEHRAKSRKAMTGLSQHGFNLTGQSVRGWHFLKHRRKEPSEVADSKEETNKQSDDLRQEQGSCPALPQTE